MSNFYTTMAATASRLINKYGQVLYLVRSGDSVDPVTGATTAGSGMNYKIRGILQTYPNNLVDGARIKTSDRLVIIGGTTTPLIADKVRFESQDWNIESIKTSNPAGTALIYFVQVRR
jgi:hypothetical protein